MTYLTYLVQVDGYRLGYVRGATEVQARERAQVCFGPDLTGFSFHPVDGLDLVLSLVRAGYNTRQKLLDATKLRVVDVQNIYLKLRKMRLIRSYDGVWGEWK